MVRGTTRLVAILGTPIAQVKSPENFNTWFASQNQDQVLIPIDMAGQSLEDFIQTLRGWNNLDGCVVTVPHKQSLVPLLDSLSERAAALNSVNVIRREANGKLLGDNVDGAGFLNAARKNGFQAAGTSVLVVGAGGVGSAIAYALAEAGVARLALSDTSPERTEALASVLRQHFPSVAVEQAPASLADLDLLVNASPVGMGGSGELPLPASLLESLSVRTWVADVVTSPEITPLLALAQSKGCAIQTGPQMARAQLGNLGAFMGVTPLDI